MKVNISKSDAKKKIEEFFEKEKFSAAEVKKIKRLAMKFNIKLGSYRRKFCKKCLSKLEGKIRINKNYKNVECRNCGFLNRFRIQ